MTDHPWAEIEIHARGLHVDEIEIHVRGMRVDEKVRSMPEVCTRMRRGA